MDRGLICAPPGALTIEAVNAQREIVKNERRQNNDNQP